MPVGINVKTVEYLFVFPLDIRTAFILLNFPEGNGSWDEALSWGVRNNCPPAHIEEVVSICGQGDFTKVTGIGQDAMSRLYATVAFAGCILHCDHPDLHKGLPSAEGFDATKHDDTWFLFHKS